MPDYTQGKIYKLCHNEMFYYGSTCLRWLCQRLALHHAEIKKENTSKLYTYLKDKDWKDVSIELVESVNCNSKAELGERETFYIRKGLTSKNCLNTRVALPDDISKQNKKDVALRSGTKKIICECGAEINKGSKSTHIKSNKHTEALGLDFIQNEVKSEKYIESQKVKMKERIVCECGEEISRGSKFLHLKSPIHIAKLNGTYVVPVKVKYVRSQEQCDRINEKKRNEKITCSCGVEIRKDSMIDHIKSKSHLGIFIECAVKERHPPLVLLGVI